MADRACGYLPDDHDEDDCGRGGEGRAERGPAEVGAVTAGDGGVGPCEVRVVWCWKEVTQASIHKACNGSS
jgi:hypothetical protein